MPFVRKARPLSDPNLRKPNSGLTKYEKVIYDIYSKAFQGVRNQLGDKKVLNDIIDALKANSAAKAPNAINWRTFVISLDKTVPTLTAQIAAMANLHSKNLPKKIRYEYNFEAKDPRAIAWAQTQAGKRIQGITLETQQAVANLISDGLRTKLTREEIIAQLRQTVGLDKRQSRALGTFYERRLNKYLEDGMTYEEAAAKAEKQGNKYRTRLVKQRAIRIARTEISAAANAGRYLSWIEADERDLLPIGSTKRWITARDERTCDICAPMNGVEIAWEMPFSTGDLMPRPHPNCRCTAVIVPSEAPILKHAPGKHDQQSHAGGRSKGILLTSDSIKPKYGDDYAFGVKMENEDWEDEELAVLGYQDGDSDFINAYARASTPKERKDARRDVPYPLSDAEAKQKISYLDRAISQAPLMEENAILYRVMDQDVLEKLSVGTVFKDKGFTSTTIRDLTAPDGKAMLDKLSNLNLFDHKPKAVMKINSGPFTQGLFVNGYLNSHTGSYASELEMLLPRNMELKYTGIENGVHMFDRLS